MLLLDFSPFNRCRLPHATEHLDHCLNCQGTDLAPYIQTAAMMYREAETFQFVQCQACQLVFLNPRVPATGLGRYYGPEYLSYRGPSAWGRYAPLVERDLRRTDRERVALVQRYAPCSTGTVVLDVGCGKPSFLQALHAQAGTQGIGLDFSDEGWEGRPADWPDLTLITGDPHAVDLPRAPQVITMWHYLEHDYAPGQTLRRLAEAARPDTRLFIEVPDLDCHPRRWQGSHWEGFHTPRHTALYTVQTLRDLLQRHSWEVVHQHRYGTLDPYALYWMGRMEAQQLDWRQSMEPQFGGFLARKILTWPLFALQRRVPLGVMTAIARPIQGGK